MDNIIPAISEIRDRLGALTLAQLDRLADVSGVPRPTLRKIRYGETQNPGIETVRQFLPNIASVQPTQAEG